MEENKKLKSKTITGSRHGNNNESRDIENLLESLHENEEEEKRMAEMQVTIDGLRKDLDKLNQMNRMLDKENL